MLKELKIEYKFDLEDFIVIENLEKENSANKIINSMYLFYYYYNNFSIKINIKRRNNRSIK